MKNLPEDVFEYVNCDICGQEETGLYLRMEDHSYGVPGTFSIVRCSSCNLLFTNPRPKCDSIVDLYRNHYGDFDIRPTVNGKTIKSFVKRNLRVRKFYHWLFGQYLSEVLLKARGRVLDIGCGSGSTMEELRRLGCKVYGIEPNPKAAKACIEKGLDVTCGVLNEVNFTENFFDTVIMMNVVEHFPSPKRTLEKIYRILRPGGHVYIYCPNANSYMAAFFDEFWRGWHVPFHFYHFTPETMSRLIRTTPFKNITMRAVTPDFVFPESLELFLANRWKSFRWINKTSFFRSFFFRFFAAFGFRLLDVCFPGKGELLQVELEKH